MTYWADVLQLRMNSGGIRQKGGRGSEKDGEIGMCVVVHAAGASETVRISGSVGNCKYKMGELCHGARGCNEVDTPVRVLVPCPLKQASNQESTVDNNTIILVLLTISYVSPLPSHSHLVQPLKNFAQFSTTFPLLRPRQIYRT